MSRWFLENSNLQHPENVGHFTLQIRRQFEPIQARWLLPSNAERHLRNFRKTG